MQEELSTRPYLFYEQIINGITDIPKRIQTYLGNVILVKNEEHRIELEKQKEIEKQKSLEIPLEDDGQDKSTGWFKLPLFGWVEEKNEVNPSVTDEVKSSNGEEEGSMEDVLSKREKENVLNLSVMEAEELKEEDKSLSEEVLPKEEEEALLVERLKSEKESFNVESVRCKIREW